jgi:hypothetical protein
MAELHLFDFDGTLFRSPFSPVVWKGDWWNDVRSLIPPCVPQRPGPDWWIPKTVAQAKRSISDPNVYAVLATGRPAESGLRYRVPELLKDKGLRFDEVHLAPPSGTLAFKKGVITQILRRYPFIHTVRIWDDRRSHLPEFVASAIKEGIDPDNVHITHVRERSKEPECGEIDFEIEETGKDPAYIAAFLDAKSRADLSHAFPYAHDKAKADHMTIARRVAPDLLSLVGEPLRMRVIGYANNDRIQAVVVEPYPNIVQEGRIPHITLSHAPGVQAKESNDLLRRGWEHVRGPTLTGIIDVHPRSLTPARRVALQYLWAER